MHIPTKWSYYKNSLARFCAVVLMYIICLEGGPNTVEPESKTAIIEQLRSRKTRILPVGCGVGSDPIIYSQMLKPSLFTHAFVGIWAWNCPRSLCTGSFGEYILITPYIYILRIDRLCTFSWNGLLNEYQMHVKLEKSLLCFHSSCFFKPSYLIFLTPKSIVYLN